MSERSTQRDNDVPRPEDRADGRRRRASLGNLSATSARLVPLVVFVLFGMYVAVSAVAPPIRSGGSFDLGQLTRLPVSVSGRVQPFDSVARIALFKIRGTGSVPLDEAQAREARASALDPNEWLLELLAKPDAADSRLIFPIDDRELLTKLSLKGTGSGTKYFAFRTLASKVGQIQQETERLAKAKEADRSAWESELLALHRHLALYERLKNSVQPNSVLQAATKGTPFSFELAQEVSKYRLDLDEAFRIAARRKNGSAETLDVATEQRIRSFARLFQRVSGIGLLALIPPVRPGAPNARWNNVGTAIVDSSRNGRLPLSVAYVAAIMSAFARGDALGFNESLAKYRTWLEAAGLQVTVRHVGFEATYNVFRPFARAIAVYLVGLVLLGTAWIAGSRTAHRSGVMLVLLAFAVHTVGIAFVIELAGRPSLGMAAAWAIALLSLGVEAFWRRGIGIAVAGVVALGALVASHALAPGGATLLLQNLVDMRLWLAIVMAALSGGLVAVAGVWKQQSAASGRIDVNTVAGRLLGTR